MANTNEMSALERAQYFAMSTRQNQHMLARETAATVPSTIDFTLPKSRLLSSLMVKVKYNLNVKHASKTSLSTSVAKDKLWFMRAIRRIALDLNNGFSPFVVSGSEIGMFNLFDNHGLDYYGDIAKNDKTLTASSTGADNAIELSFYLPCTLNDRDPIGLILLQSDQTNVRLTIDMANGSEVFAAATASDVTGFSFDIKNVVVDVMTTTYSVPANAAAYPDLSVLKLVNGRNDAMPAAGQQVIKLSTGTIYRKILFKIVDENGQPVDDSFITSPFEIVFNQADVNYSVSPEMLRLINTKLLGYELPKGIYCFDFSSSGSFVNLGGTRDYIDSANLSEMWLRFTTANKGKIEIVTECLARLTGNA